jgi:hypothetical protein
MIRLAVEQPDAIRGGDERVKVVAADADDPDGQPLCHGVLLFTLISEKAHALLLSLFYQSVSLFGVEATLVWRKSDTSPGEYAVSALQLVLSRLWRTRGTRQIPPGKRLCFPHVHSAK